ncbi:1-acyl-sn-glycerol-3-phosphate acyltransferase [Nodosilinea sp. LEGE 07298]|uniref:1-acyl-sn-glycerol-3-phosphate acyltransferase n=1 Tax=Nodosilinea sp. LEGE 07298 TaxID=2777970 RepID=UPI001882C58F|nr:1-acyl-sn-glycerol-3-phosphate acyltransferase [Nodosilinea sp. LEGE 07298]MBE9108508.1 1-acyl-sn-glycerol-3-phosphate acyltransferase [Nodosilinea sp. LEGE 07298]
MVNPSTQAQPPLDFIPPALNLRVLALVRLGLPYWRRWREQIQQVDVVNADGLVHLLQAFNAQETRFLLAFRHPSPLDSYCLAHLLWYAVPQRASQLGIDLKRPVHSHFIYDRGIPLWAGDWVGWIYSRLGGTPIQRGKVDRQGLRSARNLLANGQFPLAAAPEGGNNGHTEIVSPLEPGVAQMGFWCVEDMHNQDRTERVAIAPLGIAYCYITPPWKELDRWLDRLEQENGLATPTTAYALGDTGDDAMKHRYQRLYTLGEHLLTLMEGYYNRIYGTALAQPNPSPDVVLPTNALGDRLEALMNAALQVAETYFKLPAKGSTIDRCRRIEQAGWERIFRQDVGGDRSLSPVERGLADREAEEACLRMWHMRLVESFVAVTGQYVKQRPSAERFAETVMILRDTVCLIQGKNPFPRPKLGPQRAVLTVGEPISVSDRWPAYKANRKQAVAQLTADLQTALEAMIPPASSV